MSSPADLAVAFRSLPRRLDHASNAEFPPAIDSASAVDAASADVQAAIVAAATDLGSVATAEGVAAAIDHYHPADWSESQLASLQSNVDVAARAIRTLENLAEQG